MDVNWRTMIPALWLMILIGHPLKVSAELVIIVHPDNPIQALTEREVKKIFMGRIRMFPETALETQVVDLPEDSPQFKVLYLELINISATKLRRYRASYLFSGKGSVPLELPNMEVIKQYVNDTPSAIGYIDLEAVDKRVKPVYLLNHSPGR